MKIELKILNKEFYTYRDYDDNYMINHPHKLPDYATSGSAGVDLVCTENVTLYPGERKMIRTGLAICIHDPNVMGLIAPRSGLGTRGLVLANTIGVIDSDYQGELMVSAWNSNTVDKSTLRQAISLNMDTPEILKLEAGDRFAQLLFIPIIKASFEVVEEFSNITERGAGGFNSTGV